MGFAREGDRSEDQRATTRVCPLIPPVLPLAPPFFIVYVSVNVLASQGLSAKILLSNYTDEVSIQFQSRRPVADSAS